jgi:hypothetical protein
MAHHIDGIDEFETTCAVWSGILLQEGVCSSIDEASVIADVILNEVTEQQNHQEENTAQQQQEQLSLLEQSLTENLDLPSRDETKRLASILHHHANPASHDEVGDSFKGDSNEEGDENESSRTTTDEEEEDDGIALFDGECELCDRYIQLTKHHLIPKSTWPRIEPRLLHAIEAIGRGDSEKAAFILGPGLNHLLVDLQTVDTTKHSIRQTLHQTCDICRPCHSAVHKAHQNMELALSYCTIDLILEDEQIAKFCKWASKQRAGRYTVKTGKR